ncbi:MAG: hypothetical protein L6Q80_03225 [Dehalococcoidia bacterium]|nr:hypothetical protein [Dehalococcoidia bacterium]
MRSTSTVALFLFVVVLTAAAAIAVWPSEPGRYLPGDFWPSGRGVKVGGWERETMRLGLDLRGGSYLVLEADPPDNYEGDLGEALDVAREVLERRVNEFGVSEAEVQSASGNRLTVQVPGMSLTDAQNLIGKTAQLEFRVITDANEVVPATGVVNGQTLTMSGQYLKSNTYPSRISTTYAVNFETTSTGAKLMEQITTRALQYAENDPRRLLLIYLDDQEISSAVVHGIAQPFEAAQRGRPAHSAEDDPVQRS